MKKILRRLDEPPIVNRVAFQLWILLASLTSGLSMLLTDEPPGSIQSLLYPPFIAIWASTLVAGPAVIIYALLAKERLRGLLLEYWTLYPFGAGLVIYGAVAIWQVGLSGLLPALLTVAAGLSCFTTSHLIKRELTKAGLWQDGLGKFSR